MRTRCLSKGQTKIVYWPFIILWFAVVVVVCFFFCFFFFFFFCFSKIEAITVRTVYVQEKDDFNC